MNLHFKYFIEFPKTRRDIQLTIHGFQENFQYPMCLSALDGTHIPIKASRGLETDYFNYKKCYSVVMLTTVNFDLLFIYVNVGAPGR